MRCAPPPSPASLTSSVFAVLFLLLAAPGCEGSCTDADGDGSCAEDDCDDDNAERHPGRQEACNLIDDNCSGRPDEDEITDEDLDGTVLCLDCDDTDATRSGAEAELCDGIDQDCDGLIPADEEDLDLDGQLACIDCDDANPDRFHGGQEICDGLDDDCDGVLPPQEEDPDGDTFMECNGDCNPNDETVAPGFPELCDGFDSDCDGLLGTAAGDQDNDGLADESEALDLDFDGFSACADCDDTDPQILPGAAEVCDGVDNNCDGGLYFDEVAGNGKTTDDDGDGWSPCLGDCNDLEALSHPDNWEFLTDGLDNDCDGTGDNQPGWGPMDREDATLEQEMIAECEIHNVAQQVLGFEGQPGGSAFTTTDGVTITAAMGAAPVELLHGMTGSDGTTPRNGTALLEAASDVDTLEISFDDPQTAIVFGITGPPADGSTVGATFQWSGATLGASASVFGTVPLAQPWAFRGTAVTGNVAWDTITLSFAGATPLRLDDLWYCRGALPE